MGAGGVGVSAGRPERLVVVVGTGTEVGKTWVAARLVRGVRRRGQAVAVRKPAQSFSPQDPAEGTDAAVLAEAAGCSPEEVCPPERWYGTAMAPPMAAAALGRPGFGLGDLMGELRWPQGGQVGPVAVGVVETAGGVRSPQADDGDAVDLVVGLDPDVVVLVGDAGLGTINGVRLSLEALAGPGGRRPHQVVVVLNRFSADHSLHRANRDWLERCWHCVLVTPGDEDRLTDLVLRGAGPSPRGPDTGPAIPRG